MSGWIWGETVWTDERLLCLANCLAMEGSCHLSKCLLSSARTRLPKQPSTMQMKGMSSSSRVVLTKRSSSTPTSNSSPGWHQQPHLRQLCLCWILVLFYLCLAILLGTLLLDLQRNRLPMDQAVLVCSLIPTSILSSLPFNWSVKLTVHIPVGAKFEYLFPLALNMLLITTRMSMSLLALDRILSRKSFNCLVPTKLSDLADLLRLAQQCKEPA